MHINDLVEFIASNNATIAGAKDASGASRFTVTLMYMDKQIQSVSGNIELCVSSVQKSLARAIKFRDVVGIGRHRA